MSYIDNNGNDPALLALSTLETLNVDEDFLSKLKRAYSICNYFFDENIEWRLRRRIEKSFDGLFSRYHNRVVIPVRQVLWLKALLIEYHGNVGPFNYRRLMASLIRR